VTRKPDWQSLLHAFLLEHQSEPFRYGRWDCCLFVCSAIYTMTGVDPASSFRGAYSSLRTARLAIAAYGSGSVAELVETITAKHGIQAIPVVCAQRGDIALVPNRSDISLGLIGLNGREIILASARGLWKVPTSVAIRTWHV